MTPIEVRAKRIIETPLGSRVMLPTFGSRLFELVDKTMDEKYKLMFIAATFESFFNEEKKDLWDKELEPQQIIFGVVNDNEVNASVVLTNGTEVAL
jgi:hypothetical protein